MPSHSDEFIRDIILDSMKNLNKARAPDQQLAISPDAAIFGKDSALDSLGLVALVMDIEEALADQEISISLSDEKAMSQRHSPFRSVPTLVAYIQSLLGEQNNA